jgi:flagellar biosynthetic protein FliQ
VSQDVVVNLTQRALSVGLEVALPLLLVGLAVGLLVSIVQAVTQIQEMTLSFIPKILAMAAVLVVAGPWMLGRLVAWTAELYTGIPDLLG